MTMRGESIQLTATPVFETSGTRPNLKDDLLVVGRALGTRWKLILSIVLMALVAGIAVMWIATPTYRSSVDILVDPRARTLVGMDVVPAGLGSSSYGSDTALVDSQLQLVQSRAVLAAVVTKLGLDAAAPPPPSLFATLSGLGKIILYGPHKSDLDTGTPLDKAITGLQSTLKVERLGNTYVLRVTAAAKSATGAADIANAIAETYLAQSQAAIDKETTDTSRALEDRLAQLKQTTDAAQQALERYRTDNGLVDVQGLMVDEQQLRDLNDEATKANIAAAAAQASFDEIERLKGQPAAQLAASNSLSSTTADAIRAQLNTAYADEISLSGLYGPNHPTLVQARKRRAALEQALMQEFRRIETRAASELKTAQSNAAALQVLLQQAESRRATSNEASIKLGELKTAADNAKSIYDAFALRAAQTREQINLPTNTARIIAAAEPSATPSDPKLPVVLGIAAAFGILFGTGTAWLLHLLFGTAGSAPRLGVPRLVKRRAAPPPPTKSGPRVAVVATTAPAAVGPAPTTTPRRRPINGLFR